MCFSREALNTVPARISIIHYEICFHFPPDLHCSLLQVQPLTCLRRRTAVWVQANRNQLTPVESKYVHLVFIPCRIKDRTEHCLHDTACLMETELLQAIKSKSSFGFSTVHDTAGRQRGTHGGREPAQMCTCLFTILHSLLVCR